MRNQRGEEEGQKEVQKEDYSHLLHKSADRSAFTRASEVLQMGDACLLTM